MAPGYHSSRYKAQERGSRNGSAFRIYLREELSNFSREVLSDWSTGTLDVQNCQAGAVAVQVDLNVERAAALERPAA